MSMKTMKRKVHSFTFLKASFAKVLAIIATSVFTLGMSHSSKACLALDIPPLTAQSLVGTVANGALLLDWQSINVWTCDGYSVQVEIACNGQAFTGNGPFFFTPNLNKTNGGPMAYPQQTISLSNFCPGQVYQFRGREVWMNPATNSLWSPTYSFTVPGTYVPPTLLVTASNIMVCPPNSSTLSANVTGCGTPISYAWTPTLGLSNPNIANPVANPSTGTTYSVTVNGGAFGCWTLNGSITLNTGSYPPAIGTVVANPTLVCAGKTTTLQLTSFTGNILWQYSSSGSGPWTDMLGGTNGTIVSQPLVNTTTCFRAIVSTCSGTLTSNVVCVNANQTPTLVPTVAQANCQNTLAAVNLNNPGSSGNPITATWTPGPVSMGAQSTTATYLPGGGPTIVTATLTFGDGCISNTQFTVNPPPPVPQFTIMNVQGSQSITCNHPTITLIAANNYTYGTLSYAWSSPSSFSTTQQIDVTSPAIQTITVLDAATNCASQQTIAIYLNQTLPVSNVNPVNQPITCGPNVVITATGCAVSPVINISHYWYSPGVELPVSGGGQCSIFSPGGPGTYTHTLKNDENGCTTTKTIQVTSNLGFPVYSVVSPISNFTVGCSTKSVALVNITGQNTTPPGGALSFTALAPGFSQPSYTYSPTFTFALTTPGNYTFITRDNNNQCETRIIVPIIQDIFPPNIGVNVPTRTLTCFTPTTMLEGVSTTTAVGYSWTFLNGSNPNTVPNFSIASQTTTNTAFSGTVVNVYTLTVLNNNNLCKSSTVVPIYQNIRPPRPIINGASGLDCVTFEVTLVNGSALDEAPAFFAPLGTAAIYWDGPSPQQPNSDTVSNYKAKTVGIYTMTVMDNNNGCSTSTTALVRDNKVYPVIQGANNYSLDCGSISVKLEPSFTPSTGVTFRWDTEPGVTISNPTVASLSVTEPGDYQVTVRTTSNGCVATKMINVGSGKLTGDFEADNYTGFAPLTVNFTNKSASSSTTTGSSSVTAVWSYGNGSTRTTSTNIITSALYNQPGTYTVTMFASKGFCQDTVSKVITVDIPSKLEIPNVFTPNGDNSNDVFFIKAANLSEIVAVIYDRWGNKVYELTTDKGNIAWDGKNLTGKEAPDGTYFYIITAKGKDGQTYDTKGSVSLFR